MLERAIASYLQHILDSNSYLTAICTRLATAYVILWNSYGDNIIVSFTQDIVTFTLDIVTFSVLLM